MQEELVYFELNNWIPGMHYPEEEPFLTWVGNDIDIWFWDRGDWCQENKICVRTAFVDQSCNMCIVAKRSWVEANCPKLFTGYRKFLRFPQEDGKVYGQFGHEFPEYCEENFGIRYEDD